MPKLLVTGALGQIGAELVPALRERYGADRVIASDIRMVQPGSEDYSGPFEHLDCTNIGDIQDVVRRHDIDQIYHMAAILSAVAEEKPQAAWTLNMGSLYGILETARQYHCAVFFPSSIGAFGPSTPPLDTPQETIQRPNTIYGITKVSGELLCDYYAHRFGVDTRGLRFPGLISHVARPGGGTTDYAVDIFYQAIRYCHYTCFLEAHTQLDMMYMPDAITAAIQLMEADAGRLKHRNAYNVAAIQLTPEILAAEIRKHIPDFVIDYEIDPVRQAIADSWPQSMDDSSARAEWGWSPTYDLAAMTEDMTRRLRPKLRSVR